MKYVKKHFVLLLVICLVTYLFPDKISSQEQYTHIRLEHNTTKTTKLSGATYVNHGIINTQNTKNHHLRFFEIPLDTFGRVTTTFAAKDSNDFFIGMYDPVNLGKYGFLFRNDSCFYYHDMNFTFKHIYSSVDTFIVIKCGETFTYHYNNVQDFDYDKVINDPLEVIAKCDFANQAFGYIQYSLLDSCDNVSSFPSEFPFYELNLSIDGSYALVLGDTLRFSYFEKYAIVSEKNDSLDWVIYEDNHVVNTSGKIKNTYGTNYQEIDLSGLTLDIGDQYVLEIKGTNKRRIFYLKFKYKL